MAIPNAINKGICYERHDVILGHVGTFSKGRFYSFSSVMVAINAIFKCVCFSAHAAIPRPIAIRRSTSDAMNSAAS